MSRSRSLRRPLHVLVVVAVLAGLVTIGPAPATAGPVGPPRAAPTAGPATPAPPQRLGELPERRTRTSATRRNPNGTLTTTVFAAPVHYQAADGSWQRIDPSLRPIDRQGYRWQNTAGEFTVRFRPSLSGPGFLALGVGGRQLTVSAVGAAGQAARTTGNQISYAGAWPSAELAYSVGASGVKETVRLADAHAPASYAFRLGVPAGASATRRQDGSYTLAWPGGPALLLEAPTVTEAAEAGRLAPPDPAAKPTLEVTQDGGDLVARVGLDPGWLAAPGRRFPVELDPTTVIQPDAEDASFTPVAGSAAVTDQRVFMGATSSSIYRAALRFDLASIPARTITDARLSLYWDGFCLVGQAGFCGGVDHVLEAHRATTAWTTATTGDTLTFDPAVAGSYTWQTSVSGNRWMTWPLTGLVGSWLDGSQPNYGLVLARNPEQLNVSGPVAPGWRFPGDPTLRPKLEVTYASDAVGLLVPETVHANGAELSWTRYTGPSGAPFDRYEVHRSATQGFTPSSSPPSSTLLTTIRDQDTTTWRDTSAAPTTTKKFFYYKVVANTSVSNERTVEMPVSGKAKKVLQPGPDQGQVTYLRNDVAGVSGDECLDYGAASYLRVGAATNGAVHRPLLRFDVRDIPQARPSARPP